MKVKMTTAIADMRWSAEAGQVIDLSPEEAKRLINAGQAEEVAITGAQENAAKKTKAPKPGRGKEQK